MANVIGGSMGALNHGNRAADAVRRGQPDEAIQEGTETFVGASNAVSGGTAVATALDCELGAAGPVGALLGAFATGYAIGSDIVLPFLTELGLVPADSRTSDGSGRAAGTGPVNLDSVAVDVAPESRALAESLRRAGQLSVAGGAAVAATVHAAVLEATQGPSTTEIVSIHVNACNSLPDGLTATMARRDRPAILRLLELLITQGAERQRERQT